MKARIKPKDIFSKQTRKAVDQYVREEVEKALKESEQKCEKYYSEVRE